MLSPRLPNTFVDINTALGKVGEVVNVIGVVTDIQSPVPTQGTDWQCTVTIQDAERSILYGRDQVRVKFFRPQQQLPSFKALGDVAVFRFIRVSEESYDIRTNTRKFI